MNPIVALVRLMLLSVLRSRLFAALLLALSATVVWVPLTIRGDGTLAGEMTVLLAYTLGAAFFLLAVVTVWAATGTVSNDIREKHIQLVATKPVSSLHIWLGKWLAMVVLNAGLLLAAGITVWCMVQWTIADADVPELERMAVRREILTPHRVAKPRPTDVAVEAHERLHRAIETGSLAGGADLAKVLAGIQRRLVEERSAVSPGCARSWAFDAVPSRAGEDHFILQARCMPTVRDQPLVSGEWRIGTEQDPARFRYAFRESYGNAFRFVVPAEPFEGEGPIVVTLENGPKAVSDTLVFAEGAGVRLLAPRGTFGGSFMRSLMILMAVLAALAALGVTAGTLFSRPVAVFAACAVIMAVLVGHYFAFATQPGQAVGHHCADCAPERHDSGPGAVIMKTGEPMLRLMGRLMAPAMASHPLGRLADGIDVSWTEAWRALGWFVGVYAGSIGVIGIFVLSRRELAVQGSV